MTVQTSRVDLMSRLVTKSGGVRSEATIQSDVRILLLDPELGLAEHDLDVQLEAQVGNRRRIDVEVGCTVIEVKKSLGSESVLDAAKIQLTDYVVTRSREMGQRYVGILTDGKEWLAFHEVDGALREATRHTAATGEAGGVALLRWLEGVLATKRSVRPTPTEIADRLGADSSAHALDYSTLAALYADSRDMPTVALKRELWANLLRSALGTQFTNSDQLFLEHTLLVNSAEIIAHLVLGLRATDLSAATLLSGDQFAAAGLHGVVDRDFFDWVLEVPGGEGFVTALARRLSRFDWSEVEHDVLKVLYESVISAETRKALGEYYTPDWLANRVVREVVTDPLHQRVLDPSCGSGTFVFYAVRRFLEAADEAGMSLSDSMALVSSRVMGIDLHPVAVALARVTYLLALGRSRLTAPERGTLSVPVYLGDSLGWDHREDLLSVGQLVIPTEVGDQLLSQPLTFPDHLLRNSAVFDDLVQSLVDESGRAAGTRTSRLSEGTIRRLALEEADVMVLNENFVRLKQLHEERRNHIWSYYVRNVARPAWLAQEENRVDVLVGNPPWLSYRHMTPEMQKRFKSLAKARDFWHNESTATHQDLAGLFVARAVERYLRDDGRLAFVVPNSVIDRPYWGGFRRGRFDGAGIRFGVSWDLRRLRPHLFPRGSAVIFGRRSLTPREMPSRAVVWKGRAPHRHASLETAAAVTHQLEDLRIGSEDDEKSPYAARFSQGANLVPRFMFRVEETTSGALGVPAGHLTLRSKRSVSEKQPWKSLPNMSGTVESQFVWPTLLGEHLLPFRVLPLDRFVLPVTPQGDLMDGAHTKIDAYPGLATWIRSAEAMWREHGKSRLTLSGQIDHMNKLTQQLPFPSLRVVYAASGMHLSAALVTDQRAVIEHGAYWGAVKSESEGHYLVGVLNAPTLTDLVRPLMSYGKDERHIDKSVWKLPIPLFDPEDVLHSDISTIARELATALAERELRSKNFVTTRRDFRTFLATSEAGKRLERLVRELLGEPAEDEEAPSQHVEPELLRVSSGDLDLDPAGIEIDVDVEFDEAGRVYLWGGLVSRRRDGTQQYIHAGTHASEFDEPALAREFLDQLMGFIVGAEANDETVRVFHYGPVERQHASRLLGSDANRLLANAIDLLAVVRANYFSPGGYGLKKLALIAGAAWTADGATGADTHAYIAAARSGDAAAWQWLLTYNEADTRATWSLREFLRELPTPEEVGSSHR